MVLPGSSGSGRLVGVGKRARVELAANRARAQAACRRGLTDDECVFNGLIDRGHLFSLPPRLSAVISVSTGGHPGYSMIIDHFPVAVTAMRAGPASSEIGPSYGPFVSTSMITPPWS